MQLTFDDGPSKWTPAILDLLAAHKAKAVFFVTGCQVALWPWLLERAVAEGHQVGNHGWSHRRLTELSDDEVMAELAWTQGAIRDACGITATLWRPPFFASEGRIDDVAFRLGLRRLDETAAVVPDDWAASDPEAVARVVLAEARPGAVVSLHDGIPPDGGSERCTDSRAVTVEAVRLILEAQVRS